MSNVEANHATMGVQSHSMDPVRHKFTSVDESCPGNRKLGAATQAAASQTQAKVVIKRALRALLLDM